jgi:pyruvate-formate lyase-activating enzyme
VSYRFANILLSGPCNLRCPYCIGGCLPDRGNNLGEFPLRGLDAFTRALAREGIREVSLTGTNTEPLLYRHPRALTRALRRAVPGVRLSLHTNGVLAEEKLDVVHLFDRVCVSFPSFRPDTFRKMTGGGAAFDLAALVARLSIPVKVSTTVNEDNADEVHEIIEGCARAGVRRLSLRRVFGPTAGAALPLLADHEPVARFGGNPVYRLHDVEVTVWDFGSSELRCLNLFADGTVSDDYLLSRASTNRARSASSPSTSTPLARPASTSRFIEDAV